MKVVFELINERSGANVWAERLCLQLNRDEILSSIRYHPLIYQLLPVRFPNRFRQPESCIQHVNSWNGWAFKSTNPLVVTEHTAVHDRALDRYKSRNQRIYHSLIRRYEVRSLNAADRVTCVSNYVKKIS